jgi:uncharacterized damage-inducible protein DinB
MNRILLGSLAGALFCLVLGCTPAPPPAPEAPPASPAFRDEVISRLDTLQERVVGLAEAFPEDKYTWRPAEGVRSVSELFLHITGANFGLASTFGATAPEGAVPAEGTTDKAAITAALTASFAHLKGAIQNVAPESADQTVNLFGRDMTNRQALWTLTEHLSEHLGQGIAYARVNGVVPPWNAE